MWNSRIFLAALLVSATIQASAQSLADAYNFSSLNVQGTARSIGFGSALGSVGGDFSSLSVNPAGLGVYRSSEFSITPSLKVNNSSSEYLGNTSGDNLTQFNINNFGLVFTNAPKGRRYERRNWKAVSFAFGMNRVADFNRSYNYSGNNNTSSASLAMESDANKNGHDSIIGTLGYLGYNSYLLNGVPGNFKTIVPYQGGINQMNSVQEYGGINEYVLSLGGNYKEKLLMGVTVGIPSLNYQKTTSYSESILPTNTTNPGNFQSFNYNTTNNIYGGGVNVKIGAIYKITDYLRIGAAFHSPTYFSLTDHLDYSLNTVVNDQSHELTTAYDQPSGNFNYTFTTPIKGVLSATFILKNRGFITADYEYVNYSTMRYQYPDGYDYNNSMSYFQEQTAMNDSIRKNFGAASNFRVGAEIKLTKFFMVRAGFGYYGNPYSTSNMSSQRIDLSGGLGFRARHFFADFAVVNSMYTIYEQPYNNIDFSTVYSGPAVALPTAKINYNLSNIALTVGYKL